MFESSEELLQKIRLGEDTSLELKTVRFRGDRVHEPERVDMADELAAIANTHDGVPIISSESERLSGKKPTYRLIDDSELLLTIIPQGWSVRMSSSIRSSRRPPFSSCGTTRP